MTDQPWWQPLLRNYDRQMPDQRATDEQLADLYSIAWRVGVSLEVLDKLPQPVTDTRPDIDFVMDRVPKQSDEIGVAPPDNEPSQQLEDVRQIANKLGLYDAADRVRTALEHETGSPQL